MTATTFAHVGLAARDMRVTEQFYTKHFGFRRARVVPVGDEEILFLKTAGGDLCLEIFKSSEEPPAPPVMGDGPMFPGFRHFAFQVDSVDEKLKEMGEEAAVTQGPMDFDAFIPGWRTVWISDPDGRIIEISQGYTDQEDPPPMP
jgi:glyoxylase I family protein